MDIRKEIGDLLGDSEVYRAFEVQRSTQSFDDQVRQQIAKFTHDPRWLGCALDHFTLEDGQLVYTAAIVCDRCGHIHQMLAQADPFEGVTDCCYPEE